MIVATDLHVTLRAPVLTGVSLSITEPCIYALIGPGASGKSVLLKTLAGLIRATSGRFEIEGVDATKINDIEWASIRRRMGMLFQNYALFDFMTVGENIAFPLRRLFALDEGEIRQRIFERLERVALPGFEQRLPASLSGGQKKRVGIARATVAKAPIVFYDEPTAGLDPVTSQKIYDLIYAEQRAQQSLAVVISSDVAGVLTIADRVGMMHRGKLIFDGTPDEAKVSSIAEVKQFVNGLVEGPL